MASFMASAIATGSCAPAMPVFISGNKLDMEMKEAGIPRWQAAAAGQLIATVYGRLGTNPNLAALQAQLSGAWASTYPKLVNAATQAHHIFPQYMGGPANGPTVPLNAVYHQLITNAFRGQFPYGSVIAPTAAEVEPFMITVYSRYPIW